MDKLKSIMIQMPLCESIKLIDYEVLFVLVKAVICAQHAEGSKRQKILNDLFFKDIPDGMKDIVNIQNGIMVAHRINDKQASAVGINYDKDSILDAVSAIVAFVKTIEESGFCTSAHGKMICIENGIVKSYGDRR